ncbi:MAG: DJ-1/PfpI family protein [Planctomycetota bacterium]|nr:DJ-1/PfpI family protein [Planctomycetota bacterium]
MNIIILAFPQMTALDAIGPYEVLSRLPGATLNFVAKEKGPIQTDTGMLTLFASHSMEDAPNADILLIPGGPGTEALEKCEVTLNWIRTQAQKARWVSSVCTGSLVLGAAGLLKGRDATTHWAMLERLKEFGANPVSQRYEISDNIVTAAGVSAGIDMALGLTEIEFGVELASAIQLGIEYDPKPPIDAGSPGKAGPEIVSMVRGLFGAG